MATETIGYTDKEQRDQEWRRLRATGLKGVVRYTTHDPADDPTIIYVVAYPVETLPPAVAEAEELLAQVPVENGTEVPLTESAESETMESGGNTDVLDEQSNDSVPTGFRGVVELPHETDHSS